MDNKTDSVVDLMKPRYKVIADYPDGRHKVGNIITPNKSGYCPYVGNADQYPHLFKKLEWYEDREETEMPQYVKSIMTEKVFKTDMWLLDEDGDIYFDSDECRNLSMYPHNYLPSTETEYNSYQLKNPSK